MIVKVTWRDAYSELSSCKKHPKSKYTRHTVGYLVKKGPVWTVVASDWDPNSKTYKVLGHIPTGCITRLRKL